VISIEGPIDESPIGFFGFFLVFFVLSGGLFAGIASIVEGGTQQTDNTVDSTDATEQTETTLAALREDGAAAVAAGDAARAEGKLSAALKDYTEGLEVYHTAVEISDDAEVQNEIHDVIEQLQADHEELQALQQDRESLSQALEVGEEHLQTAIVAHSRGEETLARVRYRQARDQFAAAVDECEDSDSELFAVPLHISVSHSAALSTKSIDSVRGIDSNTASALVERDITTVNELQQAVDSKLEPVVSLNLDEAESVDAAVADRLAALCWWNEAETKTFHTLDAVSRRHEQAAAGFDATK